MFSMRIMGKFIYDKKFEKFTVIFVKKIGAVEINCFEKVRFLETKTNAERF